MPGPSATGNVLENLGSLLTQYSVNKMQDKSDAKKRQMEEELKRKYESQVVAPDMTRIEGNQEVRYNKFGEEVSRRTLSEEEVVDRQAVLEERRAKSAKAQAELEGQRIENEYKPRVLDSSLESQAASRDASRASAAASYTNAQTSRQNADLAQRRYDDEISEKMQNEVNEAERLLYAVGTGPDTSAAQKADQFRAELEGAKAKGDKAEINRILNKIRGQLRIPMERALTDAKNTSGIPLSLDMNP